MLISKKSLTQIESLIEKLDSKIDSLEEKFANEQDKNTSQINKNIEAVLEKLKQLEDKQSFMSKRFNEEVSIFSELNNNIKKRIEGFKMMENRAETLIADKAREEIASKLDSLSLLGKKYKQVEHDLDESSKNVKEMTAQMKKFVDIGKDIKSADFELANYAKRLTATDSEKLRLIRENETLKKLISKERRNRNYC